MKDFVALHLTHLVVEGSYARQPVVSAIQDEAPLAGLALSYPVFKEKFVLQAKHLPFTFRFLSLTGVKQSLIAPHVGFAGSVVNNWKPGKQAAH